MSHGNHVTLLQLQAVSSSDIQIIGRKYRFVHACVVFYKLIPIDTQSLQDNSMDYWQHHTAVGCGGVMPQLAMGAEHSTGQG